MATFLEPLSYALVSMAPLLSMAPSYGPLFPWPPSYYAPLPLALGTGAVGHRHEHAYGTEAKERE